MPFPRRWYRPGSDVTGTLAHGRGRDGARRGGEQAASDSGHTRTREVPEALQALTRMATGSLGGQRHVQITHIGRGFYGSMSAVSSGSPQGNAEVREPDASQEPGQSRQPASAPNRPGEVRAAPDHANQADFGANEWLVEELYQRYLADPGSVDRAWWSFFADYQPTLPSGTGPQPVLGLQSAPPAPAPQAVPSQSPRRPCPPCRRALRPRRPSRLLRPPPRRRPPLPQPLPRPPPSPQPGSASPQPSSARSPEPSSAPPPSPAPLLPQAQLCFLPQAQLCFLPQAHPKVPRSAGCAAPRPAPSPT